MKRLLLILLMALLLVGCSQDAPPPETTDPTQATTQPTEPPGLYVPESMMEKETAGAVRVYALDSDTWFGLESVGTNLLLIGKGEMMILSGECGVPAAQQTLGALVESSEIDTCVTGVAYYITDSRQVVILNPQLQQVNALKLPEDIVGAPVICLPRNEVYYFNGADIRAVNTNTGISRLLRQQTNVEVLLPEALFDDQVLVYRVKDSGGDLEYISAEDGQTLSQEQGISSIHTHKEQYFLERQDGQVQEMVFGTRGGDAKLFLASAPQTSSGGFVPALEMNAVVAYGIEEDSLTLSCYDLTTGKRIANTVLPGSLTPLDFLCDGTHIWMLAVEKENCTLYRWDVTKSPVEDENIYTGPFYSSENPDTQGLKECQTLADAYSKQYGVKLNIWQNAIRVTDNYTVTPEHQTQTINNMLAALQPVLAQFPEKFLLKTVEAGWIRIGIVRSIEGGKDWAHFWADGDCYILISAQADPAQAFLQGAAYAVDSHVLGNSRDFDFDRWNPLNPAGFKYANSYDVKVHKRYLEGATRAFTDELATSYIHEDRSRVFYNAMLADNREMFTSTVMQAKLKRVCMGIREAYGLQKSTQTFPWEQYLKNSLAYVEK